MKRGEPLPGQARGRAACRALLVSAAFALAACQAWAEPARYQRSVEELNMPDVVMVNQNGDKVRLKPLLESGNPVIVDFIYGTCTTICPVLSAGFSNLQRKLGDEGRALRLVSITIDPENDTPKILKEYLARYGARPGWDFLTGSRADVNQVMKAFNAFMPDKMSHLPLNFIRVPKEAKWVRLNGLISSKDFLAEYRKAVNP